ncbi:MAG: putative integrin-like protein [Myxococcaceae bacterium]|nr:putative integrin-like protein [Myxococcaceae bacterium]
MRAPSRRLVLPLVALLASGCGLLIEPDFPYDPTPDAGLDAAIEAATVDRVPATDVAPDAPGDAPTDLPTDAPVDVALDASTDVPDVVDASTDAPDAPDAPDVVDAPDVFDAPDVRDVPDAPDVFDAPDARDAPDVRDVLDVPDAPDVRDAPDAPDAPLCSPAVPVLRGPLSGSVVRSVRPTFLFNAGRCATTLLIGTTRGFSDGAALHTLTAPAGVTSFQSSALSPGETYFWRVRTRDPGGVTIANSVVNEFRVAPQPLVVLTSATGVYGTLIDGDGDGVSDLAVGVTGQESPDDGTGPTGRVVVLRGRPGFGDPALSTPITLSPPAGTDNASRVTFGARVTGTGDVDGDGYPDLLVATRGPTAFVYFGGPSSFTPTRVAPLGVGMPTPRTPYPPVAGVGDFDGDGRGDLVVGAPRADHPSGGTVTLFPGGPTFVGQALMPPSGSEAFYWGFAVAPAGDVDADGFGDFAVGCPVNPTRPVASGRVVIARSAVPSLVVATGNAANPVAAEFGSIVASAGDFDSDGRGNVAVMQPLRPSLWWVDPSDAPPVATPLEAAPATAPMNLQVTPVGDVDGDGRDDLVRWAPGFGAPTLRSGVLDLLPLTLSVPALDGATVVAVAGVGDLDDDGRDDVAVTWRRGANAPFVTVLQVVNPLLVRTVRLVATFAPTAETRFGVALGTAY